MITSIEGILAHGSESCIVVELGGMGLEINVPTRIIETLGEPGDRIRLLTWLCVREDALTLFGFSSERDRQMFLSLISIGGIGPRVAMGMLSACDSNDIARHINREDAKMLTSLPGIGKKTAERIILELKDKIDMTLYTISEYVKSGAPSDETFEEAAAALVSIGVGRSAAEKVLEGIWMSNQGEALGVEDLVREALKKVSARGK